MTLREYVLQDALVIYDKMSFARNVYRYLTNPAFKVTCRYRLQQRLGGG